MAGKCIDITTQLSQFSLKTGKLHLNQPKALKFVLRNNSIRDRVFKKSQSLNMFMCFVIFIWSLFFLALTF